MPRIPLSSRLWLAWQVLRGLVTRVDTDVLNGEVSITFANRRSFRAVLWGEPTHSKPQFMPGGESDG